MSFGSSRHTGAMSPADQPPEPAPRRAISRRGLLGGALAAGAGAAGSQLLTNDAATSARDAAPTIAFYGEHQAGVLTPPQRHLQLAAFDVRATALPDLRALLSDWSGLAARLTTRRRDDARQGPRDAPTDTGERDGLSASRLTVTFGFGPSLFSSSEHGDRFGLARLRPAALEPLPAFRGESLDLRRSDGDLAVQICADDPQITFHALHALARASDGAATLRWAHTGFLPHVQTGQTPRNLMGFKDGTNNPDVRRAAEMRRHVWADRRDGTSWMHDGSYLVARRVRMLLDVWDATTLAGQERAIGRHKDTGAPLGTRREHDRADRRPGSPVPSDAHVRVASAESNHGARLLRRSYSYSDGLDPDTGQLDAGLIFLAYQRDPRRQFVPIQRRLAAQDALARHTLHTASAVFACPPGTRRGDHTGSALFDALA